MSEEAKQNNVQDAQKPDNEALETPVEAKKEDEKKKEPKSVWTWKSFFHSFIWMAILLFAIDLISKWVVQLNYSSWNPTSKGVAIIPNFFYLYLTHNTKAAFGDWMGLGDDVVWVRVVLIVISWVMSVLIGYYWYKHLNKKDHLVDSIFALCFAGALGNAIDRTFYWKGIAGFDGVIDFFAFYIYGPDKSPFAIFNVADSCLVVGVIMAVVVMIVREIKAGEKGMDKK
ncbi:MAG: signal peptidase II [Bacilli bacterium]|jgi:signal peptidase II|nr:signal peptidase II [Bacilli bacterium]MCH4210581.1 signal peptidase II [Bacilli bacterium]MCH4228539.1 signal peptidase II [Bacilli bacterium]MCH4277325.1 signal peptidase II [Bacilli bacterium]MCI2055237.1 signal peptidase II [Bacilli bacterium]